MKRLLLLVCTFISVVSFGQIPAPAQFLGYEAGTKFTPHYKIVNYFEALAKAAPGMCKLEQYGTTSEGRPLLLLYVSSAANISNLENIRTNNLKLAGIESGTASTDAPAIVWLSYNVHGNEASSSEAAMLTAYNLLTDPKSQAWLTNTVVLIDPCLNPDGRDRYVNWYNSVVGASLNPDPQSREHSEPWPGGRSNHYNYDLNRDWAWQTQVESRSRINKYNMWMPHVHVDYHEQGFNEPYYFAPAAEPFHEVITPWQRSFQTQIGRNHAKYFDANGWLYFTKERFDLFYPSYGDTWPTYNGGIGMTYEQGGHSRGGLGVVTEDGDTLTLLDRTRHHFTTGLSTVEITSQNAKQVVENFKKYFENSRTAGIGEYKTFVVKQKGNESQLSVLKKLLDNNGIQYGYANAGTANGYNYYTAKNENFAVEKGDIIIHTTQPRGNMVKVLFEPMSKLTDSATYDITAWAVPYAYGLQAFAVKEKLPSVPGLATTLPARVPVGSTYGFIKKWQGFDDAKFLAALMQKGIKARMTEKPFEINNKQYPAGTLIIIKTSNKNIASFESVVQQAASETGVELETVTTGFMDKGTDFGSPDVKTLWAPKVALLTGDGTSSLGAGEIWYYFEKELKYPLTLINAQEAGRIDWKRFDVIIAPDMYTGNLFKKDGVLASWVQQGGKLIAIDNAVNMIASNEWGLKLKKGAEDDAKDKKDEYGDLKKYTNSERDALVDNNPGSIFKIELDNSHPLAYGYPNFYYNLKGDTRVYEFMKEGWNVGVIKKENQVAGFTGVRAKEKLKDGVLMGELPMGSGTVVFFADDPIFRSFWESGKLMLANAVFMVHAGSGFHL